MIDCHVSALMVVGLDTRMLEIRGPELAEPAIGSCLE